MVEIHLQWGIYLTLSSTGLKSPFGLCMGDMGSFSSVSAGHGGRTI